MQRLVDERRITSYKVGGKRRIAEADLEAFIEAHRNEPLR
jgi:excisionase family DNA binding protein